jgi:hypothetical protein
MIRVRNLSASISNKCFKGVAFMPNPQLLKIHKQMLFASGCTTNTLCTLVTLNPPAGIENANRLVDTALANCMFAIQAMVHGALQTTPGGIALNRDMILNIPFYC